MILTALRIPETGNIFPKTTCTDTDYQTAMQMVDVLLRHTMHVYRTLPDIPNPVKKKKRTQIWEDFYKELPQTFNRQTFVELAKAKGKSPRTAENHIEAFIAIGRLIHYDFDCYKKPEPQNKNN